MLATVFSAVLFAVSFVPSNVDATASAEPTCCAKHAYCCTVHAACCGKHAEGKAGHGRSVEHNFSTHLLCQACVLLLGERTMLRKAR